MARWTYKIITLKQSHEMQAISTNSRKWQLQQQNDIETFLNCSRQHDSLMQLNLVLFSFPSSGYSSIITFVTNNETHKKKQRPFSGTNRNSDRQQRSWCFNYFRQSNKKQFKEAKPRSIITTQLLSGRYFQDSVEHTQIDDSKSKCCSTISWSANDCAHRNLLRHKEM